MTKWFDISPGAEVKIRFLEPLATHEIFPSADVARRIADNINLCPICATGHKPTKRLLISKK